MTAQGQLTNISGAFVLTRSVVGKQVAIVDDVVTSCSTVAELAGVIKAARASEVNLWVWACART
jgi:predicted amidophosphoribosyltransferase